MPVGQINENLVDTEKAFFVQRHLHVLHVQPPVRQ